MVTLLLLALGLVLLIAGAEGLVRGASRLALQVGISPLIIGLTVVAFGTSAPELVVSIKAALDDQAGIAIGNVVGSNIFNVLFILGISALIVPLAVAQQLIRLDIPLMIGISLLMLLLALDGSIGRLDGGLLFLGLVVYTGFLLWQGRRQSEPAETEVSESARSHWGIDVLFVAGGLAMLVAGSRLFVDAAVVLATWLGVSEQVIGLTVVAAGTSLPEVVTSIVAALRGQRDIAVGNVVGSNIFNLLGVLGLAGLIAPAGIAVTDAMLSLDIPVMLAVAVACLPICFTASAINRWEGAVLLGYYVAYTAYLILAATQHDALAGFSTLMLYFVLPITGLTLTVLAVPELRRTTKRA
ncbi:calcium/sodium antiporter [Halomonas sp. MCCC 1A17488]|uniref:Calcium/sodium antiporter n=1 Tax=Billgrantia sulfidoxydans TaxID=2733484 RepID=A0ABX7W4C5_9GAMM|nr:MULTISPECIES: calcium/sodium antiporter [Halomonas]MCE8016545.1 calcium/sodium antiporter [Halomonas sp. MCCC 1A17488]MCG3239878.1 calcium/sodium antiporter [Halomonas sp. MCCC 1A17488]QPP50226.1 calcium/sodium antiporter [Halomonas sp. SS10-MC5]QTP53848.1 calcium/sodium antiporter [Halomonas sulfidoxydans]